MKQTDYAYCVARIRARETLLLSDAAIDKLVQAGDYKEAVKMLAEKHWMSADESVEAVVKRQSRELWELLNESVPDKQALELLCITNNYQNIKVAVKCLLTEENPHDYFVFPTTIKLDELANSVKDLDFASLNGAYGECAGRAYDVATKAENGQLSEIIIDSMALSVLMSASDKSKDRIFSKVCAFIADTSSIKIALRCAATDKDISFIEEAVPECKNLDRKRLIAACAESYEEALSYLSCTVYSEGAGIYAEAPSLYDKWCDDEIIKIISDAKYTAFGFAPVCSYYYKKMTEIKCVRIILSAKLVGADITTIKERVRILDV